MQQAVKLEPIPEAAKITYEEYKLVEDLADKRYEVIGGRLIMTPAPIPYHQRISRKLERILEDFVIDNDLGEVFDAPCDVVLSDTDVVQPDIFFIAKDKAHIITDTYINGAPDLIIEILSPTSTSKDTVIKKRLYLKSKIKEYWIVDPLEKEIQIWHIKGDLYRLIGNYKEKDDIVKSELLKGLKFTLKEIF
ncbi:MAG: Uma2 family endonuclease [bacterium]